MKIVDKGWNPLRRGFERQSSFVIDFMEALIRFHKEGRVAKKSS